MDLGDLSSEMGVSTRALGSTIKGPVWAALWTQMGMFTKGVGKMETSSIKVC